MAFTKGVSGNPGGRVKNKEFTDALRLAVLEIHPETKLKKLRVIANKLADLACEGDVAAIREVSDRLDGKSIASVDITTRHADARDIPDSELLDIATGSSNGTAEEAGSATEPNSVH